MVKHRGDELDLTFLLEELDSKPKAKRTFTEVAFTFTSMNLRRIYYKLDGAVHSSIVFQGVLDGLPTNGSLLGWDERLIVLVDNEVREVQRPSVLKWVQDLLPDKELEQEFDKERKENPNAKKKKLLPRTVRVHDLRLLGPDERRGLIVQQEDLDRITRPSSTKVSRLMQVEQGKNATFEWVDVKKKRGDE